MAERKLKIACEGAATVLLSKLQEFQGELKSLHREQFEMLKNEMVKTGFAFPFHVWRAPGGELKLIGGHQRKRVLTRMEEEGWVIPPLPVVWVEADDLQQAKRRVLQDVAQYGKVDGQGFYEFLSEVEFDLADLASSFKIPELNMASFIEEYFEDNTPDPLDIGPSAPGGGLDTQNGSASGAVKMVQLYFTQDDHAALVQLLNALGEKFGTDNLSDTIFKAVKECHENHQA